MKDLVEIIPDYDEKVGNMNVKALAARDAESAGYAHYMAKMLQASEAQREENRKLAEIRKKRHGIDPHAQQPSTMAILARPEEKDLEHFLRPLPQSTIEEAKKLAEVMSKGDENDIKAALNQREVSIEEVSHAEAVRRHPKNSTGQSQKSATTEEKREIAINSYTYSPGIPYSELSPEDKERATELSPYSELPEVAKEKTPQITDKKFWIYGHYLELKNWFKK